MSRPTITPEALVLAAAALRQRQQRTVSCQDVDGLNQQISRLRQTVLDFPTISANASPAELLVRSALRLAGWRPPARDYGEPTFWREVDRLAVLFLRAGPEGRNEIMREFVDGLTPDE